MPLQELTGFTNKIADLPDKPSMTASALKAYWDSSPEEVRVALNAVVTILKGVVDGDSGADNIGATALTPQSGETVQEILEYLKLQIDNLVLDVTPDASMTRQKLSLDVQKTLDSEIILLMGGF